MRKFITLFLIVLFAIPVFAKKVEVETAKNAAKNLYYKKINNFKDVDLSSIHLNLVYTETVNSEAVYYVFNVNNTEGFVIISADDIARPCIGYSFEGPFDINNLPPSLNYYMGGYRDQIAEAITQRAPASTEAIQEWSELLTNNPSLTKGAKSLQPLLLTNWDQGWPYNELCPADANCTSYNGHVLVGCVATSMSQVMKYWNYPTTGTGSHTNYSIWNGGYGNKTVNFGTQTYVWEDMPNSLSGISSPELAKLGYHCGVAVDMNWGCDGSGSQTTNIATALKTYYKYHTSCQFVNRSSYNTTNWVNLLKGQIDLLQPMCYSGYDGTQGGHAWNCDGYNTGTTTEFHMNWGWGGSANGYFTVDNLTAGGYSFTNNHGAVINIFPASNYPEGCSATPKLITGNAGTFNDGSGNQEYSNNKDCLYLIQPNCASVVSLSFDRFDLGTGDVLYIYEGTTTSDPVIATYDVNNQPSSTITANGGAMLLRFVTDGSNTSTGWYASYNTYPCQGSKFLTTPSGTVVDGSQSCDYKNSIICSWYIQPAGATSFQLTFPQFDFAAGDAGDLLKIYKNTISTSNVIGQYNATNLPPSTLDIVATKVIMRFQTNSTNTGSGWQVDYNATLTGIENNMAEYEASVFPNPFKSDATISYTLKENTAVKITLTNILGEVIGVYENVESQGKYNLQLSSFAGDFPSGMYFVNLSFNDKSTLIKIVSTK